MSRPKTRGKLAGRGWRGGVVGGVVLGVLLGGYLLVVREGGEAVMETPVVDPLAIQTAGLDPAVVELIEETVAEVGRAPASGQAWGKLGMVLMGYHFREKARVAFERARSFDETEPRWPYHEAELWWPGGGARALELLGEAARLEAGKGDAAALKLANRLAELGRWGEAEAWFQGLADRHPGHVMALMGLARARFAGGAWLECLELLKQCGFDEHTRQAAARLGASAQMRLGNRAEAEALNRVAEGLPVDRVWYDPYEAETYAMRRGRRALIEGVQHQLQIGRTAEALPLIEQLLARYPEASEGWLYLGRVQVLEKNYDDAVLALRQHLALEPESIDGLSQLGLVELNRGRLQEAAGLFEQAIVVKPDSEGVHYNLGVTRLKMGELDGAMRAFRDAIRCRPSFVEAYLMGAEVLVRQEQPDQARALLGTALELNSGDGRVRERLERLK